MTIGDSEFVSWDKVYSTGTAAVYNFKYAGFAKQPFSGPALIAKSESDVVL